MMMQMLTAKHTRLPRLGTNKEEEQEEEEQDQEVRGGEARMQKRKARGEKAVFLCLALLLSARERIVAAVADTAKVTDLQSLQSAFCAACFGVGGGEGRDTREGTRGAGGVDLENGKHKTFHGLARDLAARTPRCFLRRLVGALADAGDAGGLESSGRGRGGDANASVGRGSARVAAADGKLRLGLAPSLAERRRGTRLFLRDFYRL